MMIDLKRSIDQRWLLKSGATFILDLVDKRNTDVDRVAKFIQIWPEYESQQNMWNWLKLMI